MFWRSGNRFCIARLSTSFLEGCGFAAALRYSGMYVAEIRQRLQDLSPICQGAG